MCQESREVSLVAGVVENDDFVDSEQAKTPCELSYQMVLELNRLDGFQNRVWKTQNSLLAEILLIVLGLDYRIIALLLLESQLNDPVDGELEFLYFLLFLFAPL